MILTIEESKEFYEHCLLASAAMLKDGYVSCTDPRISKAMELLKLSISDRANLRFKVLGSYHAIPVWVKQDDVSGKKSFDMVVYLPEKSKRILSFLLDRLELNEL